MYKYQIDSQVNNTQAKFKVLRVPMKISLMVDVTRLQIGGIDFIGFSSKFMTEIQQYSIHIRINNKGISKSIIIN
ncbi:unnamed protein product [Paramecium pentaurelia]|uniref:Uncharacterized protein n=1 Tax=Paramecium pentaurelia TaxID=43138 RepID=A0A8S1XUZ9_9CILI|nr:unnamed protein product [Paramecium pentaurelia]